MELGGSIPRNPGWLGSMHVPQEENVFKTTELHSSVISLAKYLHNMHTLCKCVSLCRCVCTYIVYLHNVHAPKDRVAIIYSHCSSAHYKISCERVQGLGNIFPTIGVTTTPFFLQCTYIVYLHKRQSGHII